MLSGFSLQTYNSEEHLKKKKKKAEIFLESHVSRLRGPESKAPDIILRFGSALCIILSDGLQHSLIAAG